jgi:hypothetical protein
MASTKKKVVLTALAAAPAITMTGLVPAGAAARHPAATDVGVTPPNRPKVLVNNLRVYTKAKNSVTISYQFPCDSGTRYSYPNGSIYVSRVTNNCEYRVWIENLGLSNSHCVNPGFSGYVPGGFHYPFSFYVGRLTGPC